jgi:DNA-directed RNA polymerase subunit RPC12/RpoP
MDIVFKCPKCHQQLEVDAGAAGQQINCPACAHTLTIPALDPQNMKVGIAAHTSAAAKEEKHFSVPVTATPSAPLIKKSLPPLEVAAKDGAKQLRIKTIRHTDCKEVGHDNFDKVVSEALEKIGEDNLVSINTVNYSYLEMGTQKMLTDFGVLILYKG